jgi:diguanylate cyclase
MSMTVFDLWSCAVRGTHVMELNSPRPTSRAGRHLHAPVVLAALAVGLFAVWVGFTIGGVGVTRVVDDIATVGAAGVATSCCLRAGLRDHSPTRRFWLLLSGAAAAWTFGECAWAVYDLVLGGSVPVPSYADIGYLGAIPLAVVALLSHPMNPGDAAQRLRTTIDGAALATAVLLLGWTFVLGPVWHQSDLRTLGGVVTVGYPFGDIVIVFLIIRSLVHLKSGDRGAIAWVLVGLLAMSLSDSGYTYLTAVKGYSTGNVIDAGWIAAYLALAIGASSAHHAHAPARREPSTSISMLPIFAPYLPLLAALVVVTAKVQLRKPIDDTSLYMAFVLTGLVLIRQLLIVVGSRRSAPSELAMTSGPGNG